MHDQAIEARTRLQLERATENQAQDLENYKLECQLGRAAKRRANRGSLPAHLPRNGTGTVAGNALSLPFLDRSFDLVTCSLLVHHLERDEIVKFVNEALRVARVAVLLNDLRREPLHLALMYAGYPLFSRVTLHDGIASIRRAYTPQELTAILRDTNAAEVQIEISYLYRMGIIIWKQRREA